LDKSKITVYLSCPRRFKYQFIDNLPAVGPEISLGRLFHDRSVLIYQKDNIVEENDPEPLKRLLQNYMKFEMRRKQFEKNWLPVAIEVELKDDKYMIEGKPDRIMTINDELSVVELKTGNKAVYTGAQRVARLELGMYIYLARVNGYNVSNLAYRYYAAFDELVGYSFEDKDINKILNTVARVRDKISRGIFPKASSLGLCGKCPYVRICIEDKT
jgi:CRISPR/Cas system-associated exonuclease Cas4 (RecB family)